ncbi:MAG: hypothetical protein WD872_06160 [Pirellulaceae bacterium]
MASIWKAKQGTGDPFASYWLGLAAAFLLLSLDEVAMLHETMGTTFALVTQTDLKGVLLYPWVVPGLLLLGCFGLAYARFLLHLPRRTATLFVVAGAVFVAGAVGVEMLNARHHDLYGNTNLHYSLLTAFEEFLEMTGIVIFAAALVSYARVEVGYRIEMPSECEA